MKTTLIKLLTIIISSIILFINLSCSDDNNPIAQNNNPPIVTIITPLGNISYIEGDTISFTATATDPEDGELDSSSVVWSSNIDGQIGVGNSLLNNSLSVNSHIIILTATDSKGAVGTDTVFVEVVQNYFPVITIISPADNLSFHLGDTITFTGSATDLQDGILTGNSLIWISDIDGQIGTGDSIDISSLSAFKHVITLEATDDSNNTSSAQIVVNVIITFMTTINLGGMDLGNTAIETSDGDFMIAAASLNGFSSTASLIKVSNNGDSLWAKTYGGEGAATASIIKTSVGDNYVIAGATGDDVYLFKINTNGIILWEKSFGGSGNEHGSSVRETSDGGFIVTGYTESYGAGMSDVYVIKTDSNGDSLWTRTFGGANADKGNSISLIASGGYIITGSTSSQGAGDDDVYLIRIDKDGNLLWEKTFGGINTDIGTSAIEGSNGEFIISGITNSSGAGAEDIYLIKTDSSGILVWEKTFGGDQPDFGISLIETFDDHFVISGYTSSYGAGNSKAYLVKVDNSGNLTWQKTFGTSDADMGNSVFETSTGGYFITGMVSKGTFFPPNFDVLLIKTDSEGIVF